MSKRNPTSEIHFQKHFADDDYNVMKRRFKKWFIEELDKRQMKVRGKLFSFTMSENSLDFGDIQYMLMSMESTSQDKIDFVELNEAILDFIQEQLDEKNISLNIEATGGIAMRYIISRK